MTRLDGGAVTRLATPNSITSTAMSMPTNRIGNARAAAQPAHATPGLSPALAVLALAMAFATAQAASAVDHHDSGGYAQAALAHGALFAIAVSFILWRGARAMDLVFVLVMALVLRGVAMTTEPGLTTDAYRYVWDGRLTLAGWSPYLYIPADERLAAFRDPAIYPHINQRETAFTIYPPVAQLVFAAGAALDRWVGTAADAGHNGMKLVMLACEALIVWGLVCWLDAARLPRERVLIYAWHPLPLWEFAGQAHIDAAATALLVLGIAAAVRSRQGLAGALIAGAALVKYFPIAVFPALWKRGDWRMPAAFAVMAGFLYLPHLVVAGTKVIGFLANHLDNEGYRSGWGFHPVWLLREFGLGDVSGRTYAAVAVAVLGGVALWTLVARRRDEIRPEHLVALSAAFIWLTSSHYPWYFGWLVPLLAVYPHPAALLMTLTAASLHLPRPPDGITWTGIYALTYWAPFVLFLVYEAGRRVFAGRFAGRGNADPTA